MTIIQTRRGTAADWTSANPVLAAGEFGYETDTNKVKIGNGSSAWTALTYLAADTSAIEAELGTNPSGPVATSIADRLLLTDEWVGGSIWNGGWATGSDVAATGNVWTFGTRGGGSYTATLTTAATIDAQAGESWSASQLTGALDLELRVRCSFARTTNIRCWVGASLGLPTASTDHFWSDPHAQSFFYGFMYSTLRGDSTWKFVYYSGSNSTTGETVVDTGVPISTDMFKFHLWRNNGQIGGSINDVEVAPVAWDPNQGAGIDLGWKVWTLDGVATSMGRNIGNFRMAKF